MKTSIIYAETISLLRNNARRIVHQGGQWSGKTVNILAALATMAVNDSEPSITTVTSQSFPHLRGGALRDFENYVYPSFKCVVAGYHKTDHIFSFVNGSILEFKTFEDEIAARGPKRKRLFINEANSFKYMVYWQLDSRSDVTILDYNPTIKFWAHDKVIGEKGTSLRISDHRHNPFLSQERHEQIENIKDKELWKVYARGMTGNVIGLIYPDWGIIDYLPDDIDNWVFGIDFGYTNDPTAIVKVGRRGETFFIRECAYRTGNIPAPEIKRVLELNGYSENTPVYIEHDPDMGRQLKLLGIYPIPARKGSGSLKAGIDYIKQNNVYYTADSRNIKRETGLYVWERNDLGDSTNAPVDNNNHALDAIRYAIYSHFHRKALPV